ncbi:MAG: MarR family winged helix-turn-helix transcriptional regulator [Acidimicrobiales bacterium]
MARRDDLARIEAALTRIARVSQGREAARHRAERSGVEVSRPAVRILAALRVSGPLRMSDLARRADLEAPLLTREVRGLVEGGYVDRRTHPDDGRVSIVELTARGRAATEAYRTAVAEITSDTFAAWSAGDLRALAGYLDRVAADSSRPPQPIRP